jgi:hypothetical protein
MAGKHAAAEHEQATSKLAGTDHHHHLNRREPKFDEAAPQYAGFCSKLLGQYCPWPDCYAPTKSPKGHT